MARLGRVALRAPGRAFPFQQDPHEDAGTGSVGVQARGRSWMEMNIEYG